MSQRVSSEPTPAGDSGDKYGTSVVIGTSVVLQLGIDSAEIPPTMNFYQK